MDEKLKEKIKKENILLGEMPKVDNDIHYQIETINLPISLVKNFVTKRIVIDKHYDYCTGFSIMRNDSVNPPLSLVSPIVNLSDTGGNVYNNVPLAQYYLKLASVNNNFNFNDILVRAKGNVLNINFEYESSIAAFDFIIVLRLEKGKQIREEKFNFQTETFIIPALTPIDTIIEFNFDFDSTYKYVDGMYVYNQNTSIPVSFSLETSEKKYFELFPYELMPLGYALELHNNLFFPFKAKSGGASVKVLIQNRDVLGANSLYINMVFKLRNYIIK